MQPWGDVIVRTPTTGFNPHPPVGWVQPAARHHRHNLLNQVSILTPPGRVGATSRTDEQPQPNQEFQSSPTWSGGCNDIDHTFLPRHQRVSILTHLVGWVQPVPKLDHTPPDPSCFILTHLVGWVQLESSGSALESWTPVSILTHLVGWVQRGPAGRQPRRRSCFNPHPPGRVGARGPDGSIGKSGYKFQSSPTWSGGCNVDRMGAWQVRLQVSILTHWSGGCNGRSPPSTYCPQSSFNPHPPGRVGATTASNIGWRPARNVSILTHLSGGCNTRRLAQHGCGGRVSILTHLVGWVQPRSR